MLGTHPCYIGTSTQLTTNQVRVSPQLMPSVDYISKLLYDSQVPLPGDLCHLLNHLDQAIVMASQIKVWTDKDPLLSCVRKLVHCVWNITNPTANLLPFHTRYTELTALDEYVLLGCCVVISTAGQNIVLNQLHETYQGITKMKILARFYVLWPGIVSDIQGKVQGCLTFQSNCPVPAKTPLHF